MFARGLFQGPELLKFLLTFCFVVFSFYFIIACASSGGKLPFCNLTAKVAKDNICKGMLLSKDPGTQVIFVPQILLES